MRALSALLVVAPLVVTALGCTREIAAGLDEGEANRGVVALAHAGVDAEKMADAQAEGRYRLVVGRDEATIAISVLANEEIPRPKPVIAAQGLVPSPEAERSARTSGIASQIERTLSAVDGVHDARVHLDIPVGDPLLASLGGDAKMPKPTASVLIRHRSVSQPLALEDVKRLVAGAVSGLTPESVAVVFVPVPKAQTAGDRELAHLGPVAVTRGSLSTLRAIAIVVLLALATLVAAVLALAVRLRRAKEASDDEGAARVAARG